MVPSALPALRRALIFSVALHVLGVIGALLVKPDHRAEEPELVDIEIAPLSPAPEALPAETARLPEEDTAGSASVPDPAGAATLPTPPAPEPDPAYTMDAGVDAPIDAPPDAPIDAPPDAPIDAPVDARPDARPDAVIDAPVDAPIDAPPDELDPLMAATLDAGVPGDAGATEVVLLDDAAPPDASVALDDAAVSPDAAVAAAGSGSGEGAEGSGSGDGSAGNQGSGSIALEAGSGSGKAGQTNEPAVDGAPTTCGTDANLLTYFPRGHVVTALIRFDRLRGTEWAAQTERLLAPMPDYQTLLGGSNARISDKLEMLAISTPRPRDVNATTLVARTAIARGPLRTLLSSGATVTWSTAKGGLLGQRSGKVVPGDKRVFLAPFRQWFLLGQPADLGALTAAAAGDPDTIEATGKLPAWLGNVRAIEKETCAEGRGPALVVTITTGGQRLDLQGNDFGLGISAVPLPDRVSLAMELVKQGWLVRGNMSFPSEKAATEFITVADAVRTRVGDSSAIRMVLGKPIVRVVDKLAFNRTGARVSYTTSISIADARAILAVLAQQLDAYFGARP